MTLKWFTSWLTKLPSFGNSRVGQILDELARIRVGLNRIEVKADETLFGLEILRRRNSVYIGENVALTYLADDTPIYVNSLDFGGPANFLNGGEYEPDNLDVLLSFVRDDTVFLDIGANLGFFGLTIARRVQRHGKVHAFEPNPEMVRLFRASAFLNGFGDLNEATLTPIVIHNCAVGDANREAEFWAPPYHTGGAALVSGAAQQNGTSFLAQIRTLDDMFGPDFSCDLVKIDVEGHEINVLRGMEKLIARSPRIKILFEKLSPHAGCEKSLKSFFESKHISLYAVHPGALLVPFAERRTRRIWRIRIGGTK